MGLVQKAAQRYESAADYFQKSLSLHDGRFDAAIELAAQSMTLIRYSVARDLLQKYKDQLGENSHYLDMAGRAYFDMGQYEDAWPLMCRACDLQPEVDHYLANRAECAVYLGEIGIARDSYKNILRRHPRHQKTHYSLANLARAKTDSHIKKMLKILKKGDQNPQNNVFLYYALGKEHEDLGKWKDAFHYYQMAGDAVSSLANYNVAEDVVLMDSIRETCNVDWLRDEVSDVDSARTPIFVVGLPRTGTTLTDRILSSHSSVCSVGESQLLQMVLRNGARAGNQIGITPTQIESASRRPPAEIAKAYLESIQHRLIGNEPYFVEKMPENVLYLGFIAKAWPKAKIVHLRRHPMDACFAMFKQSYFRFAYTLEDLAKYYLAYDRLSSHWRDTLGSRMVELNYEDLVANQEGETRRLLSALGLEFEESCLNFEANAAPVATASSVQVRERVHSRSVGKWKKFAGQLAPLRDQLKNNGVSIEE